ncbi:ATP-binding cassette domain-containing protein [Ciceribacter sp. L1K23]|uniref:thiamine ABC transporter ATP-binding protein n=1 Tax=Ciceribacter sp. L1K23 TaxID=2820276 RepID=UPI001B83D35C|nr:ATP-binding cassette domain-containing protein [Ciceribacter sp. L1K23]MBR0557738.1 ATP-binding cassette domain-containing protein [Ciceribacter sp. L1K23]
MSETDIVIETVALRLGRMDFAFDCVIPGGRVTAIAGPSGAGKSTLLNLIAGFEQPDRGRILIGGQDVTVHHPADRPVSIVFQDHNLFAHLDLFTNVGLGIDPSLRLNPEQREEISRSLGTVGLGGFEKRKPPTLSGGERQRAAFARALVRRKPVLFLDEPFAALDPGLRSDMARLLGDLHTETGNTVLMISHDRDEVLRLSEHVLFLEEGHVLFSGPTSVFQEKTGSPAIERFLRG